MGAVCRAECVVDVNVAEICEFAAEFFTVFLFACVETSVFQKDDFTVFERSDFLVGIFAYEVGCKSDFAGEMLCKFVCNGLQSELLGIVFERFCDIFCFCGRLLAFGKSLNCFFLLLVESETFGEDIVRFAHMRAKDNFCAVVNEIFDGGKCAVDTVFVGDYAVNHRNVEVATNQTLFAFDVYVADCHFCHRDSPFQKMYFQIWTSKRIDEAQRYAYARISTFLAIYSISHAHKNYKKFVNFHAHIQYFHAYTAELSIICV